MTATHYCFGDSTEERFPLACVVAPYEVKFFEGSFKGLGLSNRQAWLERSALLEGSHILTRP